MNDGRTALLAAYENNDLETMNTILGANLEQNYSRPDGFAAETAKYFQSPEGSEYTKIS